MLVDKLIARKAFVKAPAFRDERERENVRIEHEKQEVGHKSLEEFFGKEFLESAKTL